MSAAAAERPRVLYVVLASEYSGAETLQEPVLRADADPLMACPPGSATERWAHGLGVPTVPLSHRSVRASGGPLEALRGAARLLPAARELRGLMRAHPEREVIVGTSVRPGLIASLAAIGLRRNVVWMVTDLIPTFPFGPAIRAVARLTRARVVCISRFLSERVAGGAAVVSLPSVPVRPAPAGERDPALALLVGHVSPTKRTDLAVEVAVRVGERFPAFRLEVVGRAQYRDEDRALEAALHERVATDPAAAAHVAFVGHDPDVGARLDRAGMLLHCRPDEPFGMVLIEAMAAGLPVVAPAAAGPLEIVVDGETGFLFAPGDADAAAAAVLALLEDPRLASRMGAAGRQRVRTHFTPERQIAEIEAVLRHAVPA